MTEIMNDALTGLKNRLQFVSILNDEIEKTKNLQTCFALLVVEINKFQRINLLHRYSIGDQVLQKFTGLLQQVGREQDVICRIGDRKFSLLLKGVSSIEHAKLAAYKIHRLLEDTFQFEYVQIHCSATAGISLYPENATDSEQLFFKAELALNQARQSGLSIGVADLIKVDANINELDLEVDLLAAIEDVQLKVFFQPKISVETGLPSGAEALVRWLHPVHGLLNPGQFLNIAESAGLMKPLNKWVLNAALRFTDKWTDKWGRLKVSVNIPTPFIEQADFQDIVNSALNLWRNENITLCLEILEGSIFNNISASYLALKNIQQLGVEISIDDFGTGYSSLAYFRDIPANELKIDQSFVLGLQDDPANMKIVNLIIDLANRFDLRVVAEGVENVKTAALLKQFGCDEFQGYYFSRPMPAEEFDSWLENYQPEHIT